MPFFLIAESDAIWKAILVPDGSRVGFRTGLEAMLSSFGATGKSLVSASVTSVSVTFSFFSQGKKPSFWIFTEYIPGGRLRVLSVAVVRWPSMKTWAPLGVLFATRSPVLEICGKSCLRPRR